MNDLVVPANLDPTSDQYKAIVAELLSRAFSANEWAEGKVIPVVDGSYRTRVVVTCYAAGRQKAKFANGEHGYGAYVELTRPDGSWISQGTNIVPVLPDGRLIMVVEQRPPQFRLPNQPTTLVVGGDTIDLRKFGPYSSVEFPGGAVDKGDNFSAGFLRELEEETEVEEQKAEFYQRKPSIFPQGADMALEMSFGVVYLTRGKFSSFVKSDGGLHVLALTPYEVAQNIWAGNIRSGQAALLGWAFYQDVHRIRKNDFLTTEMCRAGYLEVREVNIKRSTK